MKAAKLEVRAVALVCPSCDWTIPAPNGSLYWAVEELPPAGILTCRQCGDESKVPKKGKL